jgi:hypothetical protein
MPDSREGFIRGKPGELYGLPIKIDLRTYPENDPEGEGPNRQLCQEASSLSTSTYLPCGEPATQLVLSEHGSRLYPMCAGCADHNIRNRGAVLVAVHEEIRV